MDRLARPQDKVTAYLILATVYAAYVAVFALYHNRTGDVIASLAIVPVICGGWYFGVKGGVLTAIFSVLANIILRTLSGSSIVELFTTPSTIIGSCALIITAFIVGRLGTLAHDRSAALAKLEELEEERQEYINFLESLNEVTRKALAARDLKTTLKVLVERIARLFGADDAYFAFWDEDNQITTPVIAYGSMSEIYPKMSYEPGERTLTAVVMEAGRPLAIENLVSSPVSPRIASMFRSHSILGLPLIVQGKKIACFYLGYNNARHFARAELTSAEVAAQQIALVLVKGQVLEEVQKQLKQLTVLHEVALVSTRVETVDQLIERVTEIIGKNLFPDNFGVLLMDEEKGVLRPHPSYRFGSAKDLFPAEIPLGQGVSGQVVQMGQPVRIGNVHVIQNYLHVDQGTCSELCVPIKIHNRVLGVINTESTKMDAFSLDDELMLGTLAGQLATAIEQLRTAQAERRWLDQLAHSNELTYALAHITTHIEKALSQDDIIRTIGEELIKINLACLVASYDDSKNLFKIKYISLEQEVVEQLENRLGLPLIDHAFSFERLNLDTRSLSQPAVVSNPEDGFQRLFAHGQTQDLSKNLHEMGISNEMVLIRLPLVFEGHLLGILWVWGTNMTKADLPVMSIFAKQIGTSLERARLFQEVQSLALTDPLTGLQNRRSLFELGRIEFSRAHRMNRPFCCMMLDLDYFKQINDTYGHAIGDQVLQEFAERCKRSVREVDLVGRYGGEEIVIFLPETDLETAMLVAERLRMSIEATPVKVSDQELSVTVSIGVSRKDENSLELETLVARADQAMYIAKHRGRNRVAISV
ncbi:MAG TPA: diguanylate cyclase [Anaerolineales bacterium]|nr:diguanylate cyclase [Anaerolineales bacterium]